MNRRRLVATGTLFRGRCKTFVYDRELRREDDLAKPRKRYSGRHDGARSDGDIFDI